MQEPDALAVRLIIGDFLLDECCRGKWSHATSKRSMRPFLIQADKLVSYDGDPVTHYGEGHGYVVV
jgi:hypothetical protein